MNAIRRTLSVLAVSAAALFSNHVHAGGPLFPCCHQPCVKKCCNKCGDIVVHVCPPKRCCAPQRTSNESGFRNSTPVFAEAGIRPAIVHSVPQFAVSPMLAMPMVSPVAFQQPQRLTREAGRRDDDRCYATCKQLENIDEKIGKLSDQMNTITKQLGAHTLLIRDLMDRMDKHDAAKHDSTDVPATH